MPAVVYLSHVCSSDLQIAGLPKRYVQLEWLVASRIEIGPSAWGFSLSIFKIRQHWQCLGLLARKQGRPGRLLQPHCEGRSASRGRYRWRRWRRKPRQRVRQIHRWWPHGTCLLVGPISPDRWHSRQWRLMLWSLWRSWCPHFWCSPHRNLIAAPAEQRQAGLGQLLGNRDDDCVSSIRENVFVTRLLAGSKKEPVHLTIIIPDNASVCCWWHICQWD